MALIEPRHLGLEHIPEQWDAIVVGMARPATDKWPVHRLFLDHHEAVQDAAKAIECEAASRHQLLDAWLAHRVGSVPARNIIVVCAARAEDPEAARQGTRWMLEMTKKRLPVWKQEQGPLGDRWMAGHARTTEVMPGA